MPVAKLTCPHCGATLKPAKPVPEGKTVKCPKCSETFKAGQTEADGKPAARPKPGAPAKKPAAAAAASKPDPDDDDDGAAMYSVVKDEAEERRKAEEEERRQRKRRRKRAKGEDDDEDEDDDDGEDDLTKHYLKTLKSKDPRGPAQETVVGPANWALRTSLLGFFGWVFYFIAFMIPIAFPTYEKKQDDYSKMAKEIDAKEKAADKAKKGDKEVIHWWSAESILNPDNTPWSVVLFIFVLLLGMVQAALIAIASVKMQSLESYKWAVWGCVLSLLPLATFPWFVLLTATFDLLDSGIDLGMGEMTWMYAGVVFLWGPVVGGLCLKQVLQPHVRPGFEFKPD
jgi:hypothetical protein